MIVHDYNEKVKLGLEHVIHLLEVEGYLPVLTMFHKLLSVVDLVELFQFHDRSDIRLKTNFQKLIIVK
uniref:Uncharacterized protein n=1 Tax=Rhizophagus irregularis (strain DAOM 181602 / DAOM 197198 / MUCL 43194) TaxID=747089 RepID=U9T219_RHIID